MIQIEHVSKVYESPHSAHRALDDVSLEVGAGAICGIIGASGAGKSTLVRCINLLERPTSGRVIVDGADVTGLTGSGLRRFRSSIGMIFQGFSLFQQRSVVQNVEFPLGLAHVPSRQARIRALELLELVGLSDKASSYPSQLSGGQQQRVAIARALANSPKILLCDEATSALDTVATQSILKLLDDINRELDVTMVVITHSLGVARQICDKVAVLDSGRIVDEGATFDVLSNPSGEATRILLEAEAVPSLRRAGDSPAGDRGLQPPAGVVLAGALNAACAIPRTAPVVETEVR